jgi:AraC family transcriptional regulator
VNYLKQVQTGIDYIEANLDFDISLVQVAREAGLSQWHFQRIFKALTNETLKTYIRSRRLANSLDKLLATDQKILDIAIAAGYESQESFTRAFHASFGIAPGEYRKLGDKSLFLRKVEFNAEYLRHINQNISLTPEIVQQRPMRLVGLQTRFYSVDSEKNNIGAKLPPLWADFLARLGEIEHAVAGTCYGVVRQIKEDSDQLEYFAAIEVSQTAVLPQAMMSVDIAGATYAKFTHRGEVKNIDHTVNYIYSNWLLSSGKRHTSGPDLEIYGAQYDAVSDESVMHYAIPVE